jgi:hypothetical protein
MFDYTTKDGRLRIYETFHDFQIQLQNGEQKGMGDGVDSFFSALFNEEVSEAASTMLRDENSIIIHNIEREIEATKWELIEAYFGYQQSDEPVRDNTELESGYRAEISSWDWKHIKESAIQNKDESDDGETGFTWVGSVYALCPSGKAYAAWTTNQTDWDTRRDEIWFSTLESVADENGMYVTDGPEPDQIYLGCEVPKSEEGE